MPPRRPTPSAQPTPVERIRAGYRPAAIALNELASRGHAAAGSGASSAAASFDRGSFAAAIPGSQALLDTGSDLLCIARDFKAAYDRWADALDRCIRALSQADEADPTRDLHGFRALEHRVASAAGGYLSPFEKAGLHPSLHNLSDCLGSLNAALTVLGLGLLFICPPAGAAHQAFQRI